MCERRDSIRAVSAAADALLRACTSRRSFRDTVNESAAAMMPPDFFTLLGQMRTPADPVQISIPAAPRVAIQFSRIKSRGKRY